MSLDDWEANAMLRAVYEGKPLPVHLRRELETCAQRYASTNVSRSSPIPAAALPTAAGFVRTADLAAALHIEPRHVPRLAKREGIEPLSRGKWRTADAADLIDKRKRC